MNEKSNKTTILDYAARVVARMKEGNATDLYYINKFEKKNKISKGEAVKAVAGEIEKQGGIEAIPLKERQSVEEIVKEAKHLNRFEWGFDVPSEKIKPARKAPGTTAFETYSQETTRKILQKVKSKELMREVPEIIRSVEKGISPAEAMNDALLKIKFRSREAINASEADEVLKMIEKKAHLLEENPEKAKAKNPSVSSSSSEAKINELEKEGLSRDHAVKLVRSGFADKPRTPSYDFMKKSAERARRIAESGRK